MGNLPLQKQISLFDFVFDNQSLLREKKIGADFEICLVMIAKFYTNRFNLVKYNDENSFFEEKLS